MKRSIAPRRGFTMLELMVVIAIMLTVTAVTIPVVAPAIQGRQIREGARMVSTFLNAARNRAIESGRPCGVWIERMPGLREAAVTLHFAEIPPVYAGDFLDSTVECFIVNGVPTSTPMQGQFFDAERIDSSARDYWNIVVPRSRTTMNIDAWASPNPEDQQIVRAGDLIQLEGDDRLIPLKVVEINIPGATSASSRGSLFWYMFRGRNCAANAGPDGAYLNSSQARRHDGRFIIRWFDRSHHVPDATIRRTTWIPFNPNVTGIRYKIYRQPIKMHAGSIKLPEGVVIDLNFSGLSDGTTTTGTYVATTQFGSGSVNASGHPFTPRRDPNDKAASTRMSSFWGEPVIKDADGRCNDETPVIIVFSAGGQVERIYCRVRDGVTATSQWPWEGVEPYGTIHLLIGKLERIIPHEQYLSTQDPQTNLAYQLKKNWLDLDNLWVNVFAQSGFISTSVVNEVTQGVSLGDVNLGTKYSAMAQNPQNVHLTRLRAREGRLAGGR